MAIRSAPLNLLTFPQHWDQASRTLRVRFLCFPRVDPDVPLAAGEPAFADAALAFEARLVPSLARLPQSTDATAIGGAAPGSPLDQPPPEVDKAAAFQALGAALQVTPRPAGAPAPATAGWRILKPSTASWRKLVGDRRPSRFLIDEDAVACSFHDGFNGQPKAPADPPREIRWGQAMALALRTEPLARALGLIGELSVVVPDDLLANGGWLWLGLHANSDYAANAALVNLQAARIPPLAASRDLYAAALFPVDQDDFVADDAISEAMRYADGFARLVHAAQMFEESSGSGTGDGECIRIAWDDEQVATWLNRQADPDAGSPMGTLGYRVDVQDLTAGGDWHSLQRVSSIDPLSLGDLDLGAWEGERAVEVAPVRRMPKPSTDFWLPAYFATWRGGSLVLSDADLVRLQRQATQPEDDLKDMLLEREKSFEAMLAPDLALRYGHRYALRVRLADLAHGGPEASAELPALPEGDSPCTTELLFVRHRRPGAVTVTAMPTRDVPMLVLAKPLLRFPELRFAGDALADGEADRILLGKPDPNVATLVIRLEVRALAGDRVEWQPLYTQERAFPLDTLSLDLAILDVAHIADLPAPPPDGPLPIPAERQLRLVLTAMGNTDPGLFADEAARTGMTTVVPLTAAARAEAPLIALAAQPLQSFFLRTPDGGDNAPRPLELLAQDLDLGCDGLTLTVKRGRRTVLACGAALPNTPGPERAAIAFSSDADIRQRWINVLRFTVERDWSWRALAANGLIVERSAVPAGQPVAWQRVGTIAIPSSVAAAALPASDDARDPGRQMTDVIFIDAVAPRAVYGDGFPAEIDLAYRITLPFPPEISGAADPVLLENRLPIATPPRQVPALVSAGIALSPFTAAQDYSATDERERHLWLEFAEAPADPGDAYFARILAIAPDPLLVGLDAGIPTVPEPSLPLEPEWIRKIVPGQSADASGKFAMPVRLAGARDGRHFLVPLPDGLDSESPELTGMFTYEIRLGHGDDRWCMAHGRWGPPLRVAGVQHPPPPLRCEAMRNEEAVLVAAPFANPVYRGQSIQPRGPHTRLWALLYARVAQLDGNAFRNLLLLRAAMQPNDRPELRWSLASGAMQGVAIFPRADLERELASRGLPPDMPLTALATEFYTDPEVADPVGSELGSARLMRASTLVPVPDAC